MSEESTPNELFKEALECVEVADQHLQMMIVYGLNKLAERFHIQSQDFSEFYKNPDVSFDTKMKLGIAQRISYLSHGDAFYNNKNELCVMIPNERGNLEALTAEELNAKHRVEGKEENHTE